jgi:hypothetical protein
VVDLADKLEAIGSLAAENSGGHGNNTLADTLLNCKQALECQKVSQMKNPQYKNLGISRLSPR